jgi:hypothetical protein
VPRRDVRPTPTMLTRPSAAAYAYDAHKTLCCSPCLRCSQDPAARRAYDAHKTLCCSPCLQRDVCAIFLRQSLCVAWERGNCAGDAGPTRRRGTRDACFYHATPHTHTWLGGKRIERANTTWTGGANDIIPHLESTQPLLASQLRRWSLGNP